MADDTDTELEALLGGTNTEDLTPEKEEEDDDMDPELKALLDRQKGVVDLEKSSGVNPDAKIAPVAGRAAVDVTDQVKAGQEADESKTYENVYEQELGERPEQGFLTRAVSTAQDIADKVTGSTEASPTQQKADQVDMEGAEWDQKAKGIFDQTGHLNEDGTRVYTHYEPKGDGTFEERTVLIPPPDSSAAGRAIWQAGSDMYQQIGGLVTEGAIATESDLEKSVPDYELSTGENLAKDIIAIGVPVGATIKGMNTGRKALQTARGAKVTAAGAGAAGLGTEVLGASLAEAVMSSGEDSALLFDPAKIEEQTKGLISGDAAKNTSMILDGMLINGALDGLLRIGGAVANKGKSISDGTRKLVDKTYLRNFVQDGTALRMAEALDPEITGLSGRGLTQRLAVMSRILGDNSVISVKVGDTEKDIAADTMNAITNGAEAYVRETRQNQLDTLGREAFEQMVDAEAGAMTTRMISILRGQGSSGLVRDKQNIITNEIGTTIMEESQRIAPNFQTAGRETADNLVENNYVATEDIKDDLLATEGALKQVDSQLDTVVSDNPVVQDLLRVGADATGHNNLFQKQMNRIVDEGLYDQFVRSADEVNAAYDAIPNVPIDAQMLRNDLDDVIADLNAFDSSGRTTQKLLRNFDAAYQPKVIGTDEAGDAIYETTEEVLDRITSSVGFKDLYKLKGNMAALIDAAPNEAKPRLIQFRNSITSEDGQLGFVMAQGGDAAQLAKAADTTFKGFRERFYNDQNIRGLSQTMEKAKRGETTVMPGGSGRDRPDVNATAINQTIPTALEDASGQYLEGLRRAVGGGMSDEEFSKPFADYFLAKGVQQLQSALDAGNTQRASVIANSFSDLRPRLETLGATDTLSRIDAAVSAVKEAEGGLKSQQEGLMAAKTQLEAQIKDAENGILKELMSKTGELGLATSTPTKFFESLATREDNVNIIRQLRVEASKLDPVKRRAAESVLQAAALRAVAKKLYGATPTGMKGANSTTKNVKLGEVAKLTDQEADNLQQGLREIFQAEPEVAEQIADTVSSLYDSSVGQRMNVAQAGSDTAVNKDVRDAVSTSILLTLGYMNPTAAAARRLSAAAVGKAEKLELEVRKDVLERITANPEEFSALLDAVRRKEDPAAIRNRVKGIFGEGIRDTGRSVRYNLRTDDENREGGAIEEEAPWLR